MNNLIHKRMPAPFSYLRVRNLAYFFFFCLFMLLASCDNIKEPQETYTLNGSTMGTTYLVKIADSAPQISAENLQAAIDAELEKINNQMSTYRPLSEISQFNQATSFIWVPVSESTAQVVTFALGIYKKTKGAFDIAVYPLVRLWGFGPEAKMERKVPDPRKIFELRQFSDSQFVRTRFDPPSLRKSHYDIEVDLSALAKGFAVDQITALLKQHGIENFLIEIGGEIRAQGKKKNGTAWIVGIEKPSPDARKIEELIALQDRSLATSGDYRNFFEEKGHRYSHLIDPRTGRPITHNLTSVTVIADECMTADAWSTALMVLGPEEGYSVAVDNNLAALFITRARDGFEIKTTPLFPKQVQ
ncbi:MAG: FAD:protein FMN transferase [Desulfobulbaceae bacterium]|nr:FAD:protein FMN transferase [Desulfobulbaceae bacterium]